MLSTGVGAELRHPLGVCMVGGLIMSCDPDAVHHAPVIPAAWTNWRATRTRQPIRRSCRGNSSPCSFTGRWPPPC
ncbi:hypothetical protein M8494_02385 [Serratia ureilytica]